MEHIFVADTNLFFECKKLEELPWSDLGCDPIAIALIEPVQSEIDRHKKGSGRTRKRALEVFARVRKMLEMGTQETVIKEVGPHVVMRLVSAILPNPKHSEQIDYSVADNRIVGILSTLTELSGSAASVELLTDDSGPAATALSLGLKYRLIDDSWRRPPKTSDEAKENADLKKDLAMYRAQEPVIKLRQLAENEEALHVVRRVSKPLDTTQLDQLILKIQNNHPMKTDFSVPPEEILGDGTKVTYEEPSTETIDEYINQSYPDWLSSCRAVLEWLHEGRSEAEASVRLLIGLSNTGTRPASNLRITFEALGSIQLWRSKEDQEVSEEAGGEVNRVNEAPRLPSPPNPPTAVRRFIKPPNNADGSGVSGVRLPGANGMLNDIMGTSNLDPFKHNPFLSDFMKAQERIDGLGRIHKQFETTQRLLGIGSETTRIQELLSGGAAGYPSVISEPLEYDSIIRGPMLPPQHDPEGFYYSDWPADIPKKSGSLTCDLYRHRGDEEVFEVEVVFPDEDDVKGAIQCRVQAENLTEPVELTVPVSRTIEVVDLIELADSLVDEL